MTDWLEFWICFFSYLECPCSTHIDLSLCWLSVVSATLAQHWLVKNPINGASPDMYIIEPTSIHIVIQKILNKFGNTAVNSYKIHSIKLQYLRIIVPRLKVDWVKTQLISLIHIMIQKILNKSGRTTGNSQRYSAPPQYLRIIVPRFKVDWMKTQELQCLDIEKLKLERTKENSIIIFCETQWRHSVKIRLYSTPSPILHSVKRSDITQWKEGYIRTLPHTSLHEPARWKQRRSRSLSFTELWSIERVPKHNKFATDRQWRVFLCY